MGPATPAPGEPQAGVLWTAGPGPLVLGSRPDSNTVLLRQGQRQSPEAKTLAGGPQFTCLLNRDDMSYPWGGMWEQMRTHLGSPDPGQL